MEDEEVYGLSGKTARSYERYARYIDDFVMEKCESRMEFTFKMSRMMDDGICDFSRWVMGRAVQPHRISSPRTS